MKELICQKKEKGLYPYSHEDHDVLSEFKDNQLLKVKIRGVQKSRSLLQLRLFWSCCRKVAMNTDDENWNTKEKVAEQVKIKCRYIKSYIVVDKTVHIITGSISYKEMSHMKATNFINNAIEEMARFLGVPKNELIEESEKT